MLSTDNVVLHLVETAFGDRHHELSNEGVSSYLRLRTKSSIWNKENMVNLGVKHLLPVDWKYVAWVDMDVFFQDKNWALESIHQLQHFDVIQPWSEALDLGPQNEAMQMFTSFGKLHQRGVKKQKFAKEPYMYGHVGFAWCATRKFWESVNGLIDSAILGSADYMMAWACIGESFGTTWGMGIGFDSVLKKWEAKAVRVTHKQVGFTNGIINHMFHGDKKNRYYQTRNEILEKHKFDPENDIYHDEQGLIQLRGKEALNHEIHQYNLSRKEDGNTI